MVVVTDFGCLHKSRLRTLLEASRGYWQYAVLCGSKGVRSLSAAESDFVLVTAAGRKKVIPSNSG